MSLWARRHSTVTGPESAIPPRQSQRRNSVTVDGDTALRHSAVWACRRLRADLMSMMPIDTYRQVSGINVEVPKPPILLTPGGDKMLMPEWMFSSQWDLDGHGNVWGIITERNALGLPARIELQLQSDIRVIIRGNRITDFYVAGKKYDYYTDIWHERQYTVAGMPIGLSPIACAAWDIGEYLTVQQWAADWFGNASIPAARLKNTAKTIDQKEADKVKARYHASVATGDLFVHGSDWEYSAIAAKASETNWLEAKGANITDVCRYMGAPADMIDAAVRNGSITYANITQRMLQLLIVNMQPPVTRRESALSTLVPAGRTVKLNSDAVLLRMDPEARARKIKIEIDSRTRTPDEARAVDDRPPLTEADYAQFERLFGSPRTQPATATSGANP